MKNFKTMLAIALCTITSLNANTVSAEEILRIKLDNAMDKQITEMLEISQKNINAEIEEVLNKLTYKLEKKEIKTETKASQIYTEYTLAEAKKKVE